MHLIRCRAKAVKPEPTVMPNVISTAILQAACSHYFLHTVRNSRGWIPHAVILEVLGSSAAGAWQALG